MGRTLFLRPKRHLLNAILPCFLAVQTCSLLMYCFIFIVFARTFSDCSHETNSHKMNQQITRLNKYNMFVIFKTSNKDFVSTIACLALMACFFMACYAPGTLLAYLSGVITLIAQLMLIVCSSQVLQIHAPGAPLAYLSDLGLFFLTLIAQDTLMAWLP